MRGCRSLPLTVSKLILMPSAFSAFGQQLLAQQLIGSRHEVVPAQPVQRGGLRVGGCPAGGQDAGHAAGFCRQGTGARYLQELAARDTSHAISSHVDLLCDLETSRRSVGVYGARDKLRADIAITAGLMWHAVTARWRRAGARRSVSKSTKGAVNSRLGNPAQNSTSSSSSSSSSARASVIHCAMAGHSMMLRV